MMGVIFTDFTVTVIKVEAIRRCVFLVPFFPYSRPLRKMTVGMLLAALAFVVAAVIQMQIDVGKHNTIGMKCTK